jgi:hypothetical protein
MKDVSGSNVDNSSNAQHATQQNCDIHQTGVPSDFGSLAQSTESFIPHINTSSLDC